MTLTEQRRTFLRASLGMGCLALAGCDQSTSEASASSTTASTNEASTTNLLSSNPFAVESSTVAAIVARPEHFLVAFSALGGGSPLPDVSTRVIKARLGTSFASLGHSGALAT